MTAWRDAERLLAGDDFDDVADVEAAEYLFRSLGAHRRWTDEDQVFMAVFTPAPVAPIPPDEILDGLKAGRVRGNFEQARLTLAQRQALELAIAGKRWREIGAALKCSSESARTHAARAILKVAAVAERIA